MHPVHICERRVPIAYQQNQFVQYQTHKDFGINNKWIFRSEEKWLRFFILINEYIFYTYIIGVQVQNGHNVVTQIFTSTQMKVLPSTYSSRLCMVTYTSVCDKIHFTKRPLTLHDTSLFTDNDF